MVGMSSETSVMIPSLAVALEYTCRLGRVQKRDTLRGQAHRRVRPEICAIFPREALLESPLGQLKTGFWKGAMKSPAKRFAIAWVLLAGASTAGAASSDLRLIDAVKQSDLQTVRKLVAQRVDVNAAEADGSTALHWAARRDNPAIVDVLLTAGANVRTATRYNVTPLALASASGNAVVVERLLKAGADPNGTSEEGQTVLMTASLTGSVAAIKVLVAHGANVNAGEP